MMKKVAVIMGSSSDYETMKETCKLLDEFSIPYDKKVVSAHRTPQLLFDFSKNAKKNGYSIIIAAAGGAAHLPGMVASNTTLPVIGVPIKSSTLNGVDSLLSIVQMPYGVPVMTMAIGVAGAKNAAVTALSILAIDDSEYEKKYTDFKNELERIVKEDMQI
ncbi:5-(carboxyamino)imidazole ribonucleotide mutase [Helcococcus sueciensis]|uniref:5-(carboxyamino)imidazole ribonucleotide mutase n=1 Tax=Helcococcus sueciensis TaxID=241555 RepID=UPI00196A19AC